MRGTEVSVYLPEGVSTCEMYGDHPYHDVLCMMVYVCHTTANFHLKFADKLRSLDERYGGIEVFLPSCVPDIAHVVYMVHFLKRLNPDAEVLFGTDDLPCYDWTLRARFSLFVVVKKQPERELALRGHMASQEEKGSQGDMTLQGEMTLQGDVVILIMEELIKTQEALRMEQDKVKALEISKALEASKAFEAIRESGTGSAEAKVPVVSIESSTEQVPGSVPGLEAVAEKTACTEPASGTIRDSEIRQPIDEDAPEVAPDAGKTACAEPTPGIPSDPGIEPAVETIPCTEPAVEATPCTEPAVETIPCTELAVETTPCTEPAVETAPCTEPVIEENGAPGIKPAVKETATSRARKKQETARGSTVKKTEEAKAPRTRKKKAEEVKTPKTRKKNEPEVKAPRTRKKNEPEAKAPKTRKKAPEEKVPDTVKKEVTALNKIEGTEEQVTAASEEVGDV